jgi:hypothetical protein
MEMPVIWRVYPPDEDFAVGVGEYVVFQAGASDTDCDLRHFIWGSTWEDPVEGCDAESSYGVTVDTVPGVYLLTVSVADWGTGTDTTGWRIVVYSPVARSSWGRIKALYQ